MNLTKDELISLISDVTTLLGDALAKHTELVEAVVGPNRRIEVQRSKIDVLQSKLALERIRLRRLKSSAVRRAALERRRREVGRARHQSRPQNTT